MHLQGKLGPSGQATTEYILMLVVAVALFQFIANPLLKNMTDWGSSMVGPSGYYSCLLENGLLPGFKYVGDDSIQCGALEAEAIKSLTNDEKGILSREGKENLAGGEGENRGNQNSKNKKSKHKKSKKRTAGSGSSHSSVAYGGDLGGARGGKRYAGRRKLSSARGDNLDGKSESSQKQRGSGDEYVKVKQKKIRKKRGEEVNNSRARGYLGFEIPEEEQKKPSFKQALSTTEALQRKQKNAAILTKKESSRAPQAEEDQPLQFGDFLKYLIIACIIIIIFVVIGSQILEFSNKE